MEAKSVFLKCRFGDHLPNAHKPVDLSKEDADYLISQGLAVEATLEEASGSGDKALTAEVTRLGGELTAANAKVTELSDTLAKSQESVGTLTAEVTRLGGELTAANAKVTELTLTAPAAPAAGKRS